MAIDAPTGVRVAWPMRQVHVLKAPGQKLSWSQDYETEFVACRSTSNRGCTRRYGIWKAGPAPTVSLSSMSQRPEETKDLNGNSFWALDKTEGLFRGGPPS